MRWSFRGALRAALMLQLLPAAGVGAQLSAGTTDGWLDFRGVTPGAPSATGAHAATGPYRATLSTSSLADARAKTGLEQFNVFCFDWTGMAGDSRVQILTLEQAAFDAELFEKFRSTVAPSGRAISNADFELRLRAGAWLTTNFGTQSNTWDEVHVALWNLFWDAGTSSASLPDYTTYGVGSNGGVATAQQWVQAAFLNAPTFDGTNYRVLKMVDADGRFDPRAQNFLAQATTVPEPSTVALLGIGLVAVGVVARRRR